MQKLRTWPPTFPRLLDRRSEPASNTQRSLSKHMKKSKSNRSTARVANKESRFASFSVVFISIGCGKLWMGSPQASSISDFFYSVMKTLLRGYQFGYSFAFSFSSSSLVEKRSNRATGCRQAGKPSNAKGDSAVGKIVAGWKVGWRRIILVKYSSKSNQFIPWSIKIFFFDFLEMNSRISRSQSFVPFIKSAIKVFSISRIIINWMEFIFLHLHCIFLC